MPLVTPSLAVSNCTLPHSPLPVRDGSLCSVPACAACGRLLPSLLLIGSIKTGSTLLWGRLVDYSEGAIDTGRTTDKGYISKKEKDFFGDPAQWRRGRGWYERAWPKCPASGARTVVGIDATPAYHVWYDAPKNMAAFYGRALGQLRLVWMLRDPVAKYWSYFWELKSYGGDWDRVTFDAFTAPKLNRSRDCAPHLDHGLYHPQLQRWLEYFQPAQLLLVQRPAAVVRDVVLHAGLRRAQAERIAASAVSRRVAKEKQNSKASGHGRMPPAWRREVAALYAPFLDRFYSLVGEAGVPVSPLARVEGRVVKKEKIPGREAF
ncbi:hypothetical protein EMIHUDRAFT_460510 [Emiliania huxleyi CCMP1516]|uniref:Sulfotransferase domain-containing protein n=2 Tax=Emiliania huxleyi TaxID=2903 RepID=A0A0D3KNJ2_EMIH1|nr:hypothetical protein EMIHUDRAFT_460510 [Emiliania huxleyi CCMP1516]EOD37327.1 hypothetical protein EMIHUDRAFT_460510 [Emiliania huxleyi CCMP1516]|eukprot:XP_005789756.1 hypothetical protein EMIHUDRAFT_460510 [Emiliania huxleyi CCMP1516]